MTDGTGGTIDHGVLQPGWVGRGPAGGRAGVLFAGKVELFNRNVQLANPEYQLVDDDAGVVSDEYAGALIPIYPATAKVSSMAILRSVRHVLEMVDFGADPLPSGLRPARACSGCESALETVHRPTTWTTWPDITRAKDRLKWDEAFVLQVTLAQRRLAARALPGGATRRPREGGLLEPSTRRCPSRSRPGRSRSVRC